MVQIKYIIFYYKRSDHIFTFCFLKVDSKKAALWRANLKTFAVKAMVAWHMRIFCCETFFCQNSHTNFIEPRTRCNKNRKKYFQIQFKMVRCFFEEIKVLLLACCRNVEKIEDIFQSHFNAVKNTSIFSWTISCWD